MKKWIIAIVAFLIILTAAVYIFIPSTLTVSEPVAVRSTERAASRILSDITNWNKWASHQTITYGYRPVSQAFNPIPILIHNQRDTLTSSISILPIKKDSVAVIWQCTIAATGNPFKKIAAYMRARNIKNQMENMLARFRAYVEKIENVYGLPIVAETVKDTLLVATKFISNNYPSVSDIYTLVDKLKKYIAGAGATETNFPMLHIRPLDDVRFETMVAIPVDSLLQAQGDIFSRRMVAGNILVTEVTGGPHAINNALKQLEIYLNDHQRASPAIPFESLVTDRTKQPDTSKWVTKVYYPVM